MSKTVRSGLRTVQRDFSESSFPSSSPIEWEPTPPQRPEQRPLKRKLTGSEQRLKDIQDALNAMKQPLSETVNKRTTQPSEPVPVKKARQLPPSWLKDDTLSSSSFISKASAPRSMQPHHAPAADKTSSVPKPGKVSRVFLSKEQKHILKLVEEGQSVFYTGSAGTGKSVLLREIIKALRKKYQKSPDAVAVTASTGIAACNIGGVTVHSFAGIGLGIESPEQLASRIRKNRKAMSRWQRTKVLIIDEVSMVDGDLFDKLVKIGSMIRKDPTPFGGIQLVVTGDFFQLPPVTKSGTQVKFAFEAEFWSATVQRTFNLTKVFRQKDEEFVRMLNEMRYGKLSGASIARFRTLSREINYEDGIAATELFPMREDVDRSNSTRMSRLDTERRMFKSSDAGTVQDQAQREKLLANFMAPRDLHLRVDAQVMLIKNVDESLANGTIGKVVRFVDQVTYTRELSGEDVTFEGGAGGRKKPPSSSESAKIYPEVEFILPNGHKRLYYVQPETWKVELPSGEVQVSRTQLPLILSWAMSIHKSQGQTLERVKVDLARVFEKGQAYVALSRATSLNGLQVLNFNPNKVTVHPKVVLWSETLETLKDSELND